LRASQVPAGRLDGLLRRHRHLTDELLLAELHRGRTTEPSLLEAARWTPPWWFWRDCLDHAVNDALAARVLARGAGPGAGAGAARSPRRPRRSSGSAPPGHTTTRSSRWTPPSTCWTGWRNCRPGYSRRSCGTGGGAS